MMDEGTCPILIFHKKPKEAGRGGINARPPDRWSFLDGEGGLFLSNRIHMKDGSSRDMAGGCCGLGLELWRGGGCWLHSYPFHHMAVVSTSRKLDYRSYCEEMPTALFNHVKNHKKEAGKWPVLQFRCIIDTFFEFEILKSHFINS